MTKRNELPDEIGPEAFANLIGVSTRRVSQMVSEGVAIRVGRGKIALAASVRNLIATARSEREAAPLSAARARAADARADLARLRLEREAGELIPLHSAIEVVERVGGMFVSGLSGLPARATRDLAVRREIEGHCDALRNEICATIERIRAENRAKPQSKRG